MQDVKEQAALGSIAASAALTLAKGIVGILTGSLAILSEAAHSLLDLAATVMTYVAVRISGKPADEQHHYGHGKVESISALAETGLLFLLSGVVIWEAGKRLWSGDIEVEATLAAFAIMAASIVIDFFRARLLYRVAEETSSEALEADALHFGSDMWSSAAVLVGLVGVFFGFKWADPLAAIVVAIFICLAGWRLARRTLDTLIDTAPEGIAPQITSLALAVPGVVAVERVRARRVGSKLFVELAVAVSRTLPIDHVANLKQRVTAAIQRDFADAEVNVSTEPRALDDESVLQRVNVIARNHGLAVHHVTVHAVAGKLVVSLDLEIDGKLSLREAHDIATELEQAVEWELGPEVEVETHIEPLQTYGLPGEEAPAQRLEEVHAALKDIVEKVGSVCEVHDVRVRRTNDGEIVNFHCRVDPGKTVHAVHEKVDEVERALRRRFPSLTRVVGHAEPTY